jgi:hypothetical protein
MTFSLIQNGTHFDVCSRKKCNPRLKAAHIKVSALLEIRFEVKICMRDTTHTKARALLKNSFEVKICKRNFLAL